MATNGPFRGAWNLGRQVPLPWSSLTACVIGSLPSRVSVLLQGFWLPLPATAQCSHVGPGEGKSLFPAKLTCSLLQSKCCNYPHSMQTFPSNFYRTYYITIGQLVDKGTHKWYISMGEVFVSVSFKITWRIFFEVLTWQTCTPEQMESYILSPLLKFNMCSLFQCVQLSVLGTLVNQMMLFAILTKHARTMIGDRMPFIIWLKSAWTQTVKQ